jgi:hypothetical protein
MDPSGNDTGTFANAAKSRMAEGAETVQAVTSKYARTLAMTPPLLRIIARTPGCR